jgi:LysM repeat protein
VCPLCGARVSETATRCLVCGTHLARPPGRALRARSPYPSPIFLALLAVLIAAGGSLVLMATGKLPVPAFLQFPTPTITPTFTPRPTGTATATPTATRVPTPTPLPPVEHLVVDGDSCLLLALIYDVTVESIIFQNNLDPNCTIAVGHTVLIPQPTATLPPPPTVAVRTSPGAPTRAPTVSPAATYVVAYGDTCLAIALRYGLTTDELMQMNGLHDCNVLQEGQVLAVPGPRTPTPPATGTPTGTPTAPSPAGFYHGRPTARGAG